MRSRCLGLSVFMHAYVSCFASHPRRHTALLQGVAVTFVSLQAAPKGKAYADWKGSWKLLVLCDIY